MRSFTNYSFAILFILSTSLSSQSLYRPFPTDTATWLVDSLDGTTTGCMGYCASALYTQMGDTVINALPYKKLYSEGGQYYNCGSTGPPNYTPIFCFASSSPKKYLGGLRQDSLNRKVFFIPWQTMHDTLLYDFNLHIGDTLPNTYLGNCLACGGDTSKRRIHRIDSLVIDGHYHRAFMFDTSSSGTYTYLIEGVGTSFGPLSSYYFYFELATGLRCFKGNSIPNTPGNYPNVCLQYQNSNIVRMNARKQFIIRPNPSGGWVEMNFPQNILFVHIFDIMGTEIKIQKMNGGQINIDLHDLENGIYFVRVFADGQTLSQKLIINH